MQPAKSDEQLRFEADLKSAPSPFDLFGLYSRYMFGWVSRIVEGARRWDLSLDMLPGLSHEFRHQNYSNKIRFHFTQLLGEYKAAAKPVTRYFILRLLVRTFLFDLLLVLLFVTLLTCMEYASPFFLLRILSIPQDYDKSEHLSKFVQFAAALVVTKALNSILNDNVYFMMDVLGRKNSFALSELVLEKSFRVSNSQNPRFKLGDIISFGTSDSDKFGRVTSSLLFMIYVPVSIGIGIYFLYALLGLAFLPAILIMAVLMVFNFLYARKAMDFQRQMMKVRGRRVEKTTEVFNNIRFIKSNCLELFFARKIDDIRMEEVGWIRRIVYRQMYTVVNMFTTPSVMNIVSFATFLLMGYQLNVAIIFTTMSVMRNFNWGLSFLPNVISAFFDFLVSSQRLTDYLMQEEIVQAPNAHRPGDGLDIDIRDYGFAWGAKNAHEEKEEEGKAGAGKKPEGGLEEPLLKVEGGKEEPAQPGFKLNGINLQVKKGALVGVIGSIRSGKTSLSMAILNEMYPEPGQNPRFAANRNVSFVAQKPWIRNETLKENVLFGKPYDEARYRQALHYAFLDDDLKELEKGDMTVIGDKGINLSGGQKTRVALARALYSDSELVLLDDPLSALDVNVGNQVFEETIAKHLAGRTRVVVTHNIIYLRYCDQIIVMDGGRIQFDGTFQDLLTNEHYQEFETVLKENQIKINEKHKREESEEAGEEDGKDAGAADPKGLTGPPPLLKKMSTKKSFVRPGIARTNVENELKDKGEFSWSLLLQYTALGSHLKIWLVVGAVAGLCVTNVVKSYFYNAQGNSSNLDFDPVRFIKQMSLIEGGVVLFSITRVVMSMLNSLSVTERINKLMIFKVLHASIPSFFNLNPVGKILNRLSGDLEVIDWTIPFSFAIFINLVGMVGVNLYFIVVLSSPWVLLFIVVYFVIVLRMQMSFKKTYSESTRIASSTKSPFFHHFSDAVNGLTDIRVLRREGYMVQTMGGIVDTHFKSAVLQSAFARWFRLRVSLLANIFVIPSLAFLVLFEPDFFANLAILVSTLISNIDTLIFLMNNLNELDKNFIAFDRCNQYINMDPEPGLKHHDRQLADLRGGVTLAALEEEEKARLAPIAKTPVTSIEFKDVSVRYNPDSEMVLKHVDLLFCEREKVGIIGRTGAGKSSLISLLLRFFDRIEGRLELNGKDVFEMDTKELRMQVVYIPQDSLFFEDTLRNNLDPFRLNSDAQVIGLLKEARIYDSIELHGGLGMKLNSNGANLSAGEKQTLCFVRALLNNRNIVILDEATANMDLVHEKTLEGMKERYFGDRLMLTVAHRLRTINNSDRILILERGRVKTFAAFADFTEEETQFFDNYFKHLK